MSRKYLKWRILSLVTGLIIPSPIATLVIILFSPNPKRLEGLLIVPWLIFIPVFVGTFCARKFERNPLVWGLLGFIFGFSNIILGILGSKSEEISQSSCPSCGSYRIEKPVFGKELDGAPERGNFQFRKYQKCKNCNNFFSPKLNRLAISMAVVFILQFPIKEITFYVFALTCSKLGNIIGLIILIVSSVFIILQKTSSNKEKKLERESKVSQEQTKVSQEQTKAFYIEKEEKRVDDIRIVVIKAIGTVDTLELELPKSLEQCFWENLKFRTFMIIDLSQATCEIEETIYNFMDFDYECKQMSGDIFFTNVPEKLFDTFKFLKLSTTSIRIFKNT